MEAKTNSVRRRTARRALPSPSLRRALRIEAGVGVGELASWLGVSRQCVYYWETGRRSPRGELLERYVEALQGMRGAA